MMLLRIRIEFHIYGSTLIIKVLPNKLLTHGKFD